jgi:hypothetical protein
MKAELDDLESVKVTGRHQYLRAPKVWKTRWRGMRLVVLSAIVPVAVFIVALIVTHCHR